MKIYIITLVAILLLSFASFGQGSPTPDRWHNLIIDSSSPDEAIKELGKADADKTDSFRVYKIEKWLTKTIRDKNYRRLEYKKIEGFSKVILAFSDNKLVFIELNPKKLSPNVLDKAYGIEFKPAFGKLEQALNPKDFERDNGDLKAKKYPVFYYLIGVSPKTFLVGGIGNSSIGSVLGVSSVNDDLSYPGEVEYLQIVSRTLENKENIDILK